MGRTAEPGSPGNDDLSSDNRMKPASQTDLAISETVSFYRQKEEMMQDRQRVKQLDRELRELESRYYALIDCIPELVYSLDEKGIIMWINPTCSNYGYTQEELRNRSFADLICHEDRHRVASPHFEAIARKQTAAYAQEFRIITKSGNLRWLEANCSIRFNKSGKFVAHEGVCRDVSGKIENYQTLVQAQAELEQQIKIRTEELLKANAELKREIDERRATEQALLDREADLQMEKDNLQQANTAMKVLLKRREADKRALEEQVLYNIKTMVMPYLHKLKRVCSDDHQQTYINIAETNLKDVTGGFSRSLSLTFYNLTGSEIKVATLIRQGKKSREIAKMLGLSVRTVEANRQSIRNKLNIANKSVNLRTFLMSLE